MSKAFETHKAAILAGEVSKTNVVGLRKHLNAYERKASGWSVSRTAPEMSFEDCEWLFTALADIKPRVVGKLHDTGKALLQNKRYRKQLASVADIVADLSHFKLVGFDATGRHGEAYTPVYRAYDTQGRSFPFRNIPWQSGGNGPEILSGNYW